MKGGIGVIRYRAISLLEMPRHSGTYLGIYPFRSDQEITSQLPEYQKLTLYDTYNKATNMPQFGTPSVAVATTPTVISTFFSHLFARKNRKSQEKKSLTDGGPGGGPENELSYEEGLKVVRRFLEFASRHGVEEVQAFTAMKVPNSREASFCFLELELTVQRGLKGMWLVYRKLRLVERKLYYPST